MHRRSGWLLFMLLVTVALALSRLIAEDPIVPSGWREVPAQLRREAWAAFSSARPQDATPAATPGVARVPHTPGVRLVERMPPGDDAVEFVAHAETPFVPAFRDDARAEISYLVSGADAIVVAEAVHVQAALTPGEDSIESTVDLIVREVLRSGNGLAALAEGHALRFRVGSGTMLIGGRQVTKRWNAETLPRVGGKYVYFLFIDPVTFIPPDTFVQQSDLLPFSAFHTFEIDGAEFRRMWRHPGVRGALDIVRPDEALEMVRSVVREQRR